MAPSALKILISPLILIIIVQCCGAQYQPPQPRNQDQHYPAKAPSGPNVCKTRSSTSYCCPGWTKHHQLDLCVTPICSRSCGSGRCIRPNVCMCENGEKSASCPYSTKSDGRDGGCRAICMNGGTCNSGKCTCATGYEGEFCTVPICLTNCKNGGRCIGPDKCACMYGFAGKHCEIDLRTGPCYTGHQRNLCINQLDGVVCTKTLCCATVGKAWGHPCEHCPSRLDCETGFLKNQKTGECVDINECDAIPHLCGGGHCVNTIGSFTCDCPEGQSRNLDTNKCDDKDECDDENVCENGRCVNTNGGFYCLCHPGFIQSQDRTFCIDGRQGSCFTRRYSPQDCRDPLPMRLSRRDCCCGMKMGKGWGDGCDRCPEHGEDEHRELCYGKPIEHRHKPGENYTTIITDRDKLQTLSSHAVNECILNPGNCGKGQCVDKLEGYECICDSGYRNKGKSEVCEDINECAEGKCQNGNCRNTPGSFDCHCPVGFDLSPDGTMCTDHDECKEIGMCTNGICTNMDGSYKCNCKSGFKLSATGFACIDIDECYENPKICLNGRCDNTQGSYTCMCQHGFIESSDKTYCLDQNECENKGMCSHGMCVNMQGSFKCVCDVGYRLGLDGHHCVDINECEHSPCKHGTCHNTQGSFRCECHAGFSLGPDGRSCVDTRKDLCYQQYKDGQCFNPSPAAITKSSCCCCTVVFGQPMGWGAMCQACPMPGSSEFDLLCPHGPGSTFDGNDINECAQNPYICQNGACENIMGGYRCVCNPGFHPDDTGKLCTDINECLEEDMICHGGQCKNTPGSFQCNCPTGTKLNPSTYVCEDIDECMEMGPETCFNGDCVNTFGSFKCDCDDGYVLDSTGRICLDNRKATCWRTHTNHGGCENSMPTVSRRMECCCTVGMAWGSPCNEPCSRHECGCPRGFAKLDGVHCTDVNECELDSDICRGGGTCVNTEGSYTCTCPPGLTLDASRSQCLDIRLEQCYGRFRHGDCTSPIGGLFRRNLCCCSSLGRGWGDKCEACPRPGTASFDELCPKGLGFVERRDINECTDFPGMCENGRCRNTVGDYHCQCNKGYAYDDNKVKCIDIDECSITTDNVCGEGVCRNIPGDFVCECNKGFRTMAPMQVCMDINECNEIQGLCRGGTCINSPGSYECLCPLGLELSTDKQSCKDIDECSRTSGICSNGVCENLLGAYQCTCNEGYIQKDDLKTHCKDIDECEDEPCDDTCHNIPGSFSCSCGQGYTLHDDNIRCINIDECKENPRICNGGKCIDTEGSFLCHCTEGLETGQNGKSCLDINECLNNPNICGNGLCENTRGSYECACEDGYSVKPDDEKKICTDDNECDLSSYNCHVNADCINVPGSYHCRCHDGFTGNGVSCRDINECLNNNGGCDNNAQCINSEGSFKCVCDAGYKGDGYKCHDIDECLNDSSLCENGQCLNHPGAFRCECEMGFMHPSDKDDQSCKDIDECTMFHNLCVYGKCDNTHGMFRCECNEGYKLDGSGGNCTDIDECESPQACLYGTCLNKQGSFDCQCPPNHDLVDEGNACIDRRSSRCYLHVDHLRGCSEPTSDYVTLAACCCSVGRAWGPQCEYCPAVDSKEYQELCPGGKGYKPNDKTVVLEDINECDEHNLCVNGHCTNTFGSFMCSCKEGYRMDVTGAMCEDINECHENPNICGIGDCINEPPGSYYCLCPDGYVPLPGRKECVDMRKDLCFLSYVSWECSTPMTQNQTKKLCCCSMGQAWGQPCEACPISGSIEYHHLCGVKPGQIVNPMTNLTEEINECELMPNMCGNNGYCMNTPGSFDCDCKRGFIYDTGSHQCIDDNECLRVPNPCEGNAQCVNLQGSFECSCPEGYKHGATFMDCVDVNECVDRRHGICANGECKNFQGSFQCLCNTGYVLAPSRDTCVDIDECQRPNICNDGSCMNMIGSYKCYCHPGFILSHNNDCVDVDECHMMSLCRHGRCRNNPGSFSCECTSGFVLTEDGHHCRDIDECHDVPGTCPHPGKCINIMGSYICTCPDGYELSPITNHCEDIDDCLEPKGGGAPICEHGTCINTMGGAYCTCPPGFVLDERTMRCKDRRREVCYDHFFSGRCSEERRGVDMTRKECCCSRGAAWGSGYCEECPREGSEVYHQLCPEGFGRMDTGKDINECLLMPNVCEGGDCVNTDGSFRCTCPEGYVLDNTGKRCIDDNECVTNRNVCGNGTCTNVQGGFECDCSNGFAPGPAQICEDVNECMEMGNQCAFRCHNVPGSFRCFCPYGFTLAPDARHCQDVDECLTPANNCKFLCKNLIGSFMCLCPPGYNQVDMTDDCRDVNECLMQPDICGVGGNCINLQGSFRCDCTEGYEPTYDRKRCIDKRQGLCYQELVYGRCLSHRTEMSVSRAECCCTIGAAWGSHCEICPSRYSPQYQDLCLESGYTIDGLDIDECAMMPDLCRNGTCINTAGSYRCSCHKGFKMDSTGLKCVDINECKLSPSPCKSNCQNTEGSFICSCNAGYLLNPDGVTCRDLDECATGEHICQHNCINTQGSYECSCRPGYTQIGDDCHDINECLQNEICPKPGRCVNKLGSFKCICPRGFKLDATESYCIDANECLDDTNCEEGCQNLIGGYKCGCPEGYKLHHYYNHCVDENECLNNPCGSGGSCINIPGSFQCGCPDGYQFDNRMKICIQVSIGCAGAPCSFGCTPGGGAQGGFSCGCPQGYKAIGYGHCLSSIGGYGPDIGNVPTYPIGDGGIDDKTISTEGCFSCKLNGRHRRDSKRLQQHSTNYTDLVHSMLRRSPQKSLRKRRTRRHHHGQELDIKINLAQTRHKIRLIKIQPAVKGDMEYVIAQGNENNKFVLKQIQDIWVLHFRRRLKQPGIFELVLHGRSRDVADVATSTSYEKPLVLRVKLTVHSKL